LRSWLTGISEDAGWRSPVTMTGVSLADMQGVQDRVGGLRREEQAAVAFAIVEALGPLAELGDPFVAPAGIRRLMGDALSAGPGALPQVLAEVQALPVMAADQEPPGVAVFAVDLLACLIYAIKTVTEADPEPWSGSCIQRAYDCLWFADERLGFPGLAARLLRALDAWLGGDGGDQLRRESGSFAALPGQLRQLS
jgi:hypothetical protein